jgi:hypothetical protein
MTYEERTKLNELSVKAFGGAQKWNKLYKKGYPKQMVEVMPDGTERKYKGIQYQTVDEIVVTMHEMIAKKEQEEREKKVKESQEAIDKLNEFSNYDKALVPGTEQTMDEIRREGTYE